MSSFITWQSSALLFTVACGALACSGSDADSGSMLSDTAVEGGADVATDETSASKLGVDLGSAGTFAILAKTGISSVPASAITGDLGVSPAAASYVTGFSLTADSTNVFSTSPQVTGKVYASNFAAPTPAKLTTAISDMQTAFTDAASRAPKVTELGAGNIGGKTLSAGVYAWGTGLLVPTDVTLDGSATDVWIFQIAKNLTIANGTKVVLAGGAQAKNVYWQVAGAIEVGTTAHLEGIALVQTSITLRTGASVKGRLLAQTAVSIDHATVVAP
ncbi:MAG: ice-binding family protein [Polyangiales bacterium]